MEKQPLWAQRNWGVSDKGDYKESTPPEEDLPLKTCREKFLSTSIDGSNPMLSCIKEHGHEGEHEYKKTPKYFKDRDVEPYKMCKNDQCANIVGPSKNKGIRKVFCKRRCAQRFYSRAYDRRKRGTTGQYLERDPRNQRPTRFDRQKPLSQEMAEFRYEKHKTEGKCPNASPDTSNRCPGVLDPYSKNKILRCLIYAVLVDDMKERWDKEYLRQYTTHDGRWIDESEFAGDPHVSMEEGMSPWAEEKEEENNSSE